MPAHTARREPSPQSISEIGQFIVRWRGAPTLLKLKDGDHSLVTPGDELLAKVRPDGITFIALVEPRQER